MRKIVLLSTALFGALIVISCEDNESSLQNETLERNNKSYTVQANSSPEFSSAEKRFSQQDFSLVWQSYGRRFSQHDRPTT